MRMFYEEPHSKNTNFLAKTLNKKFMGFLDMSFGCFLKSNTQIQIFRVLVGSIFDYLSLLSDLLVFGPYAKIEKSARQIFEYL